MNHLNIEDIKKQFADNLNKTQKIQNDFFSFLTAHSEISYSNAPKFFNAVATVPVNFSEVQSLASNYGKEVLALNTKYINEVFQSVKAKK